jgi:nitrate/TMAO reductase-like tetraheme cytochrome c subunit
LDESKEPATTGYYRNWISFAGIGVMLTGFFCGLFVFVLEFLMDQAAPYVGVLYMACTGLVVAGFLAIPVGMALEKNRRITGELAGLLSEFHFDLNKPEHRYVALSFLAGGMLVLLLVAVGTYKTYHATESVSFCGQLCHSVMNPEWVRYQDSPHARVKCSECHIGAGADWFVRSKLSGLRQVWAVAVNSFSRPIPTPIHDLRPARETCEECHWRRKFIGYKEIVRSYFLSDEENSHHQLRMLVKIGGEKTTFLKGSGIHYHMLIASHVEYIATDDRRQEIAWVRVTRGDGSVTEYNNQENLLSEEERAGLEVRTMDCMDCHNRPAHQFPTAMERVNQALEEGSVSRDLPFIKVEAVRALDTPYPDTETALVGIANQLRDYYRREHSETFANNGHDLTRSIQKVKDIYSETVFPEMKANWSAYPNNIGHRDSPGCFRCHTEEMQSDDGEAIFTTCNRCHLILAQGQMIDEVNVNIEEGLPFIHPEDFEPLDEFTECSECHDGGVAVYE